MMSTQSTYDHYTALCRERKERDAVYYLFSSLARRSIQEFSVWYQHYDSLAALTAQCIIAGTY